jgi:uracil-DNA glycosylase family 4
VCKVKKVPHKGPVYDQGTTDRRYSAPFVVHNSSEEIRGKGFVGPSGSLLWTIAKMAGLEREDVWVTNAALCRADLIKLPNGGEIPKMKAKALAAAACRMRLINELRIVSPSVIVPLGNWALWALTDIPNAKIYAYRGSRVDMDLEKFAEILINNEMNSPLRKVREKG